MKIVKIVTHHENPERAAELFYQEGVAAIGWSEFGDLSDLTEEQIKEISQKKFGRTVPESINDARQYVDFRDNIGKGDLVLAYRKNNIVAMIGEIESDPYFDDKNIIGNPDGEVGYANQRKMKWWIEPRNFHRSHLPDDLKNKVALPGTISIIAEDYDKIKLIEHLRKEGLNVIIPDETSHRNWWIEKTYVKGNPDRESGDYALGKALWSPQRDKRGADSYKNMREIKKGDIVLHLINNENIVGVSVVERECDDTFKCLPGTEWDDGTGNRLGYLIRLKDYQELNPPMNKEDILDNKNRNLLISLLEKNKNLFYNRDLELRQGAYITRGPLELVSLINEVYKEKTGENLPYFYTPSFQPSQPELLHLLYKIAWHPGGYKGGFCWNIGQDICKAFEYIRSNREKQECSPETFYCIDEHEAFSSSGWRVTIHPPRTKSLQELSDGRSLIFLAAPTDKNKSHYRLVGFYTLKRKIVKEGEVEGLEAERESSSKFDLRMNEFELDNDKLKELFNMQRWSNPRLSYEFISSEVALKALNYVLGKLEGKKISDPDVNIDAIHKAIDALSAKPKHIPSTSNITISEYLLSRGFKFEEALVSAFYAALKTKGFVILAGLTGTGKTKLPQLICDLIASNNQKLFMPIRPDWRDSKPLIGYFNPIENAYESTELLGLIEDANNNWKTEPKSPFFVLLDEMNLARVEYYFADFLSVLESGRDEKTSLTKESLLLHASEWECKTRGGKPISPKINLPPNLYFIGTVNLDETTYSFSPKVLDRAFVIEFWKVDLENYPSKSNMEIDDTVKQQLKSIILDDLSRNGKFIASTVEDINSAIESLGDLFEDLKQLHRVLQDFGLHFGYRVINEIALFYNNALESMEKGIIHFDSKEQILDYAVLMKILPKIHGNRSKVEAPLARILEWAINSENPNGILDENGRMKSEYQQALGKGPAELLSRITGSRKIKYRHIAEKVARMLCQLYSTGFTTYL